MPEELTKTLMSLHTAAIDASNGYEEALKDAEGRGMTPLFHEMITLHQKHSDELAALLRSQGEVSSDDGSFMTTVHRTIMSIRGLFGGLGESVLPGLIDGEKRNVSHYDEACNTHDISPTIRTLLEQQKSELKAAISRMQVIKP